MAKSDNWWSYPCEAENGRTIIVSGHDGLDRQRNSGKYRFRVEASWKYPSLENGMPDQEAEEMLEKVTEAFEATLAKDSAAVMTGIYTGDGCRDWVFYTLSLGIFSNIFNRALKDLPLLPLEITAEEDPEWEEYLHLREETFIPPEED